MRNFAERLTRFKSLQVAIYAPCIIFLYNVLSFPFSIYEQFFREHKYGLSTQTFGAWFGDQLKALVIALIGLSIVLAVLYAVFRRAPRTWWMWGTVAAVVLMMIGSFLAPIYILPVFNKYKPLQDPAIRDPISDHGPGRTKFPLIRSLWSMPRAKPRKSALMSPDFWERRGLR